MRAIINIGLFNLTLVVLAACSSESTSQHTHNPNEEKSNVSSVHSEQHAELNNTGALISMLETQAQTIDLKLGQLDTIMMGSSIRTYGWLRLPPQHHARVSAFFSGSITDIPVIEGDFVRQGDTLAIIRSQEILELQQEYMQSLEQLEFAKAEFQRQSQLYRDSIASIKQLQQAETAYRIALTRLNSLRQQLQLANLNPDNIEQAHITASFAVLAPIDGYVRHINVVLGEFISPGQELFEIVNNAHIHADIYVFEQDIPKVREQQLVRFSLATRPDKWYEGTIFAVGKAFEDSVKAVIVHAELTDRYNANLLLPGMFVNAQILTSLHKVSALPESAVVEIEGQPTIFIFEGKQHHPDGTMLLFRTVPVTVGERDRGMVAVTLAEPIPDTAQIVVQGAYYLYAQTQSLEAEHAH